LNMCRFLYTGTNSSLWVPAIDVIV